MKLNKQLSNKYLYINLFLIILLFAACSGNIDNKTLTNEMSTVVLADDKPSQTNENALISSFSTKFSKNDKGRNENIAHASSSINEKVVAAGETFSFNDTIGPTSKKNGYKLAKVFDKGREAKGYGGGVCQVSSTLYNACLAANLEIIERHPHSKRVKYVAKDKDAATSYGKIDFKFKNNLTKPIKIMSTTDESTIDIRLVQFS